MSLFQKVATGVNNFFQPKANETRVRDFARELPGATVDTFQAMGQGSMRLFGAAGAKIAAMDPKASFKPQGQFQEDLYGTKEDVNFTSEAAPLTSIVGVKPDSKVGKIVNPTVGFVLAALELLPGGSGTKKAIQTTLKESAPIISALKNADEIIPVIKKMFGNIPGLSTKVSADEITSLAADFANVTDTKQIEKTLGQFATNRLNNVTTKPLTAVEKAAQQEQDVLSAARNLDKIKANELTKSGEINLDAVEFIDDFTKRANKNPKSVTADELRQAEELHFQLKGNTDSVLNPRGTPRPSTTRGVVKTVQQNDELFGPEIRNAIKGDYDPISNKAVLKQADDLVKSNFDEAVNIAKNIDDQSALSTTVRLRVAIELQRQAKVASAADPAKSTRLFQEALDIMEAASEKATNTGQANQAFRLWSKSEPEGIILYTNRLFKKAKANNPRFNKKVDADLARKITERVNKIKEIPEGPDKIRATAKMMADINALVPTSLLKKISSAQTILQLLNPKTAVRNVIGNAGMMVAETASDAVGAVFESPLRLIPGYKPTQSLPNLAVQMRGFVKGLKEGVKDVQQGVNTGTGSTQFDLPLERIFKDKSIMSKFEKLLNYTLKPMDRAFFNAAYENSLYKQMKAQKLKVPTEKIIEEAVYDGMYRTFQDENVTTKVFQGVKKVLNAYQEFGLGDLVIKYPKTPANLLNRGFAYSPAGYIGTVMELAKPLFKGGDINAKRVIDSLSRATVGTAGLFGIGYKLADTGIITTTREKQYDVAQVKREVGLGEYKLNVDALKRYVLSGFDPESAKLKKDDTLVSYDWFQPVSLSLALGADYSKRQKEGSGANSVLGSALGSLESGVNTLAEQPLVSGITNIFKYGDVTEGVKQTFLKAPSSFVPTLANQIRQLMDNTQRNTYDANPINYSINMVKSRLPFVSDNLQPKYGTFGQEQDIYQDDSNGIFNVLFNPSFVTQYKPTPEAKLVLDLFKASGDSSAVPNLKKTTQRVNGKDKELSPRQYAEFQKYSGTVTKQILEQMATNDDFRNMPTDNQIDEINKYLTAIGSAGKILILGDRPAKQPSDLTLQILESFKK